MTHLTIHLLTNVNESSFLDLISLVKQIRAPSLCLRSHSDERRWDVMLDPKQFEESVCPDVRSLIVVWRGSIGYGNLPPPCALHELFPATESLRLELAIQFDINRLVLSSIPQNLSPLHVDFCTMQWPSIFGLIAELKHLKLLYLFRPLFESRDDCYSSLSSLPSSLSDFVFWHFAFTPYDDVKAASVLLELLSLDGNNKWLPQLQRIRCSIEADSSEQKQLKMAAHRRGIQFISLSLLQMEQVCGG